MRITIAISTFLLFASVAGAQQSAPASNEDSHRVELYGGYSYLNADLHEPPARQSANGWDGSVAVTIYRILAVEGDVSGYYTSNLPGSGLDTNTYLFLAGPRVNLGPVFFHALVGVDHISDSGLSGSDSMVKVAGFGGGYSWKFARHWAFRPYVDYLGSQHNILGFTEERAVRSNFRIGAGFAYTF